MKLLSKVPVKFLGVNVPVKERVQAYSQGGLLAATSRTFIIDALNSRLLGNLVDGVICLNAHKLAHTHTHTYTLFTHLHTPTRCRLINRGNDMFVVQLLRKKSERFFVRAITELPRQLVRGFSQAERTMRMLGLTNLQFGARSSRLVSTTLDNPKVCFYVRVSVCMHTQVCV